MESTAFLHVLENVIFILLAIAFKVVCNFALTSVGKFCAHLNDLTNALERKTKVEMEGESDKGTGKK